MLPATARTLLNWEAWQKTSASWQTSPMSTALQVSMPNLQIG